MCWIDSIVNAAVVKFNALGAPGKALFDGRTRLSCDVVRMKVWNVQQKEAFLNITWVDNGNNRWSINKVVEELSACMCFFMKTASSEV